MGLRASPALLCAHMPPTPSASSSRCSRDLAASRSHLGSLFGRGNPSFQSSLVQVTWGKARLTCLKKDIHPKFHSDAKVYCNGELVMLTGGTQPEYVVDVWSGNHPFFQGNKSALVLDADRVDKFKKRYGNMNRLSEIPVLTKGEIVIEKKKKKVIKKGGKK